MKKYIAALALIMTAALMLTGCGINFGAFSAGEENEADTNENKPINFINAAAGTEKQAFEGVDRIFYDNTQTVYSYLSSHDYLSAVHAVMQAETLRNAEAYTLQIRNGRVNDEGMNVGFLHWQPIEFNALKTCFADKSLYTFAQNNEVPKLSDKGPLGLIFEDQVLDPDNLSIIVTDMMENNFGASSIAKELTSILTQQEGVQITLYGFKCDGFSGNMSFPGYTTAGSVVKTVENYRGLAAMYILVIGPSDEVFDFGERLEENIPEEIHLNKTVYVNGDTYPGETGIGTVTAVQSLENKISGGHADTLNYTVNAEAEISKSGGITFDFNSRNTPRKHRDEVQISLIAPLEEGSPFYEDEIKVGTLEVRKIEEDGKKPLVGMDIKAQAEAVTGGLDAWKKGAERSEALNKITKEDVLHILVNIPQMPKGDYEVHLTLEAGIDGGGWIDEYSASVYEYQSLSDLLPQSGMWLNHLVWQAGSTDILSRTLDLRDVDSLLSSSVTQEKTVLDITFNVSR